MTQSDLDLLIEMGFDRPRAELAVKKSGGLQGALQWLEDNQDKPLEELQAASSSSAKTGEGEDEEGGPSIAAVKEGESAKSLVCNECGKMFRNPDLASFHASKTQHTDFSESTVEIAPLTEEEKKAKLAELREKLKEKKANMSLADKEDNKRNEQIRRKATTETQDMKEELQRKEQLKEAERKRQEKLDDLEAKKRIKAKLEADKEERRRKAEATKAMREGRAVPGAEVPPAAAAAAPAAPSAPKPAVNHTEARLKLQTAKGNIIKTFSADQTLFEVAQVVESEHGGPVKGFTTNFPRKTYEDDVDFSKTLKELGFVPSAMLIVKYS